MNQDNQTLREKVRIAVRQELDSVYGNSKHPYTPTVGEEIATENIMQLIEADKAEAVLEAKIHWMRNTSQVLKYVIDADTDFMGDSKKAAKHWKTKTDELIEAELRSNSEKTE